MSSSSPSEEAVPNKRRRKSAFLEEEGIEIIEIISDDDDDFRVSPAVAKAPPKQKPRGKSSSKGNDALAALMQGAESDAAKAPAPTKKRRQPRGTAAKPPPVTSPSGTLHTATTSQHTAAQQQQQQGNADQLWVERHAPRSESDLVVHKKKVQEVGDWLQGQLQLLHSNSTSTGTASQQTANSRVLLLTGPPGSGKSTVLRVLCSALGITVSEWRPPVPTLWDEYQYTAAAGDGNGGGDKGGARYESKLDSFEEFVLRCKMPALQLTSSRPVPAPAASSRPGSSMVTGASPSLQQQRQQNTARHFGPQPKLVLIEDLPNAANIDHRKRLAKAFGDLATTARFPVVVCVTEMSGSSRQEKGGGGASGSSSSGLIGLHKDLLEAINATKPAHISFNPVTTINIAKALNKVLDAENRVIAPEQVKQIAEQADGDLNNALATLQFVCTGVKPSEVVADAKPAKKKARKAAAVVSSKAPTSSIAAAATKDASLGLYHALGKFLYNKRLDSTQKQPNDESAAGTSRSHQAVGPAWSIRRPMEFDPEAVLTAAGLEASSVTAFLHENYPNFIDDSAISEIALAAHYFSQSDLLYSGIKFGSGNAGEIMDDMCASGASSTLLDAIAASTAARGLCFANEHPAPRKWQPLKGPIAFAAQRAVNGNSEQLRLAEAHGRQCNEGPGVFAAEVLPVVRTLQATSYRAGNSAAAAEYSQYLPGRWSRLWNGQVYEEAGGGPLLGAQRQHIDRNVQQQLQQNDDVVYQERGAGATQGTQQQQVDVEEDMIEVSDSE